MPEISLKALAIILGLGYALPQVYGLVKPTEFGRALREFPRSNKWGYLLVTIATLWFLRLVQQEDIADFAAYKKIMLFGFAALGIATCLFVRDFLAVRGYAVLLLLLAKLMTDSARWVDSDWRLVIMVWAYIWVLGGMWFTVSPWRVRDIISWKTASDARLRLVCAFRSAFGLFVFGLGVFIF